MTDTRADTRIDRLTGALALAAVHKSFGAAAIIHGVDLSLVAGERHALIGPNGAGKSTLFNLISGRYPPTRGQVMLHGETISGLPPHKINRKGLSRSFQTTNLFQNMTVFENLRCALLWTRGYRYSIRHLVGRQTELNATVDDGLRRLGLHRRRNLPAAALTYAEQRMLELGMTIVGGADVILLDEPMAGMSRGERDAMLALIRAVTVGKTLFIIEHDMDVVFDVADRISVLVHGRLLASDVPERIRGDERVRAAYLGV